MFWYNMDSKIQVITMKNERYMKLEIQTAFFFERIRIHKKVQCSILAAACTKAEYKACNPVGALHSATITFPLLYT